MGYATLIVERREAFAILTLNRPQVLNAINAAMREELVAAIRELEGDETVRCLILRGAGDRAFSAGADVKEFAGMTFRGVAELLAARQQRDEHRRALEAQPRPTIAAIHGLALGGGLELAMACDLRVAAEEATLGYPEINVGIVGGTTRVPRVVGRSKAMELVLTCEPIDAAEALRIGLVNRVVPLADLMPTVERMARTIASKSPIAVRLARESLRRGTDLEFADHLTLETYLGTLMDTTEDKREGARAFAEKRPPHFTGR
jgi:enoyl-CoA hydratase